MEMTSLSNAQLAELLAQAALEEQGHRRQALDRATRAAYFAWPEEAALLRLQGRSLTELRTVGPWVAGMVEAWLADPPDPVDPPELRRDFLTLAEARATVAAHPDWRAELRADLQMHTTYSDGKAPLRDMVSAVESYGYEFIAVTDHSKGLPIANGMDEDRLVEQGEDIERLNDELEAMRSRLRLLHGIEMNLSPTGEGDMDPAALRRLDLVLGAFHSALRRTEDQTDRYLAAVRNPTVHVLAHPRCRRWGARAGLQADWPLVFDAAAEAGTALEIDAFPDRQDLDVQLLEVARESDVMISVGTDAHHPRELANIEFGLAAAIRAGIPRARILNYQPRETVTGSTRRSPS
jgi:histidinol phosphatase-like PHP family hydrolase